MAGSFLAAYEEHVWTVYGFLAYRTANREEAEDLTQLTFERALRAWQRFDPSRASAKTWLLSIARNALIDERRRDRGGARPLDHVDETAAAELSTPGPEQSLRGVESELADALGRLGQQEREVLALRFGGDLKSAEIAEVVGLTTSNVHQITSRALRKLRGELESRQGGSARSGRATHPSPDALSS